MRTLYPDPLTRSISSRQVVVNGPKTPPSHRACCSIWGKPERQVRGTGGRSSDPWRSDRIRRAARSTTPHDESSGREMAKATVPANRPSLSRRLLRARGDEPTTDCACARCGGARPRQSWSLACRCPRPIQCRPRRQRHAAPRRNMVRESPERCERRHAQTNVEEATVPEASLVFETRALVGTRKPKEQSAQLVLAEGKITIIPTSDPSPRLCHSLWARDLDQRVEESRPAMEFTAGAGPGCTRRRHAQQVRHCLDARMDLAAHQHRRTVRRDAIR